MKDKQIRNIPSGLREKFLNEERKQALGFNADKQFLTEIKNKYLK